MQVKAVLPRPNIFVKIFLVYIYAGAGEKFLYIPLQIISELFGKKNV
jgi:hypothetical protein